MAAEKQHRLRVALAPATPSDLHELFRDRFGLLLRDGFGMTETNAVIGALDGRQPAGTMGYVMPGYEARVVDENDEPVADGTPSLGELETLEQRISRERAKLHERIDWMRGNHGDETTIATMLDRERKLSDRRRALHRAINELRTRST